MKKLFQKKYLAIFLGLLILSIIIPQIILADVQRDFYQSPRSTSTPVVTQAGGGTIINRSDKAYFVPNKTSKEWYLFASNTPQYISITVCGDNICSEGETMTSCPQDCSTVAPYCGDGICSQGTLVQVPYVPPRQIQKYEQVCTYHQSGWMWVPVVNFVVWATGNEWYTKCDNVLKTVSVSYGWEPRGEVWEAHDTSTQMTCKDDCAPPAGTGCGVCGYDTTGNACPNFCNDRGYNMVNCAFQAAYTTPASGCRAAENPLAVKDAFSPIKKYLTASDVLASTLPSTCANDGYSYTVAAHYTCSFSGDTTSLCPAGSYCPLTGGLKPGTTYTAYANTAWLTANGNTAADLQQTCAAGFFCPTGASYPHICPSNTYSTGGATACTACPAGTISPSNSQSIDFCQPTFKAGDSICNGDGITGENPANSPYDCPDSTQITNDPWKGDHRCTGVENMVNDPVDCSCGNGVCDNGETPLSCMKDCAGLDNTCGTIIYSNGTSTIYRETNKVNSYGKLISNTSDCKYMNDGEVCGDGVCSPGEGYNASIGRIVCKLDCHCGDGSCNSNEFYSSTSAAGSCNMDCHCGDGSCNYSETSYSCSTDCHCGNGKCEVGLGETKNNCSADCVCGDNLCTSGETATSCPNDCGSCNNNGSCEPELGESKLGKCTDCGYLKSGTTAPLAY